MFLEKTKLMGTNITLIIIIIIIDLQGGAA